MRSEKWNEILNQLDDDIVEEFVKKNEVLEKQSKRRKLLMRFTALAACVCLIISSVVVAPMLRKPDFSNWENAQYSAENIAKIINTNTYDSTNTYKKIHVSDSQHLDIGDIPESEYLGIYRFKRAEKTVNESEFDIFSKPLLQKCSEFFHSCNIVKNNKLYLQIELDSKDIILHFFQNKSYTGLYTSRSLIYDGNIIYLKGEPVQIDQRLTDEEIIASLESIKQNLFNFLGVSFTDVKIIRKFDVFSKNGANWVYIYFYDKDAHPLNSTQNAPVSDYICIEFDNRQNSSDDIVSDSILQNATIQYYQYRTAPTDSYNVVSKQRMISIKEAEELLYKGYVFGGHSCKLCMAEQDKISFEGYDFVDLEYVFEYVTYTTQASYGIPFYAFYKQIGTAENGNLIYAKTYVPAIEVRGYEEYFESQTQKHTGN